MTLLHTLILYLACWPLAVLMTAAATGQVSTGISRVARRDNPTLFWIVVSVWILTLPALWLLFRVEW